MGRYYFLKVGIVLVAIATVTVTSGVGTTRVAHAINHARYSAPAQVEAATWRTTAKLARTVACLFSSGESSATLSS